MGGGFVLTEFCCCATCNTHIARGLLSKRWKPLWLTSRNVDLATISGTIASSGCPLVSTSQPSEITINPCQRRYPLLSEQNDICGVCGVCGDIASLQYLHPKCIFTMLRGHKHQCSVQRAKPCSNHIQALICLHPHFLVSRREKKRPLLNAPSTTVVTTVVGGPLFFCYVNRGSLSVSYGTPNTKRRLFLC